ncbi:MAG: putative ABC transporter C family member 11 [Streblomastix strix]|uniref:Putative ABC transporter C family member 11 n=1 Tax=Streblomastix strix TaxID=222440 RepID=A0A5J4URZ8_9EUKA|nr:MAG: putative ABC transporter C family member 11 [Streblomastix strix]
MIGVILIGWKQMEASKLTVAIIASTGFGFLGVMIVQLFVELESKMTSFDRIHFYSSKLPQEKSYFRKKVKYGQGKWASEEDATEEAKFDSNGQLEITPDNQWPEYGMVQFDNISFRYRSGQPYVLNEKIGVCGRTGAGKTSLLFALFRLVELDHILQPSIIDVNTGFPIEVDKTDELNKGRVLIDGIDISKVDISRVRRSIAIIPQDPTLFTRTLSYNLDIGKKCNDDQIWEVLDMIGMNEVIASLPLGLDTQVAEGGSNFSAGQHQLIYEATASADAETDAKIQKTIREQIFEQTIFVIAHRLNTIMNSDRIMVIQQGRIAELDVPTTILISENSTFNKLVKSLDH